MATAGAPPQGPVPQLQDLSVQPQGVMVFREAGIAILKDQASNTLTVTLGSYEGDEIFSDQALLSQSTETWYCAEILARSALPWDSHTYSQDSPAATALTLQLAQPALPATATSPARAAQPAKYPTWLFVGYNGLDGDPASLRKPNANTRSSTHTQDNLLGFQISTNAASEITGRMALVPGSLVVGGNISKLKQLMTLFNEPSTTDADIANLLSDSDIQTLDQLASDLQAIVSDLRAGLAPKPIAFVKHITPQDMNRHPTDRPYPTQPQGPNNRPFGDGYLSANALLYRNLPTVTSFVWRMPPVMALNYDDDLVQLAVELARKYPRDLLKPTVILWAIHCWVDIYDDPNYMKESFCSMSSRNTTVPYVPLAVFIIYFEHWMAITFKLGLAEWPHPSRQIFRAYQRNCERNASVYQVDPMDIDEDMIRVHMSHVSSKVNGISSLDRFKVLPMSFPGHELPFPSNLDIHAVNETIQALCGMGHVSQYGRPSYHFLNDGVNHVTVAIPSRVLNSAFYDGPLRPVTPDDLSGLFDVQGPGPTSIFGPTRSAGPIWMSPFGTNEETTTASPQAPPEGWPRHGHLSPDLLDLFVTPSVNSLIRFTIRASILDLINVGMLNVTDLSEIMVGNDFRITYRGMPSRSTILAMTVEERHHARRVAIERVIGSRLPAPEHPQSSPSGATGNTGPQAQTIATASHAPTNNTSVPTINTPAAPVQPQIPMADHDTLQECIGLIESMPRKCCHRAFRWLSRQLHALTSPINPATNQWDIRRLVTEIEHAQDAAQADIDLLEASYEFWREGPNREPLDLTGAITVQSWLPGCIGRLSGFDAGQAANSTEWSNAIRAELNHLNSYVVYLVDTMGVQDRRLRQYGYDAQLVANLREDSHKLLEVFRPYANGCLTEKLQELRDQLASLTVQT